MKNLLLLCLFAGTMLLGTGCANRVAASQGRASLGPALAQGEPVTALDGAGWTLDFPRDKP